MKRKALLLPLLPLLALATIALAALHPLNSNAASSLEAHLLGIKGNILTQPANNLQYHGGPIMPNTVQAYAIFWEPTGSYVSPNYNSLIIRYFGDVGGSPLYHNNIQYKDSGGNIPSGAVLGGSWLDTAAYPSNYLTDQQIQNEVTHAMSVNGWTSSLDNAFFVFTAKGENICTNNSHKRCSFKQFCAYHLFFGSNTIYGVMPYAGTDLNACGVNTLGYPSPNNDIDADSTINLISHEQMEAATDPLLNAWNDHREEIGDKCQWILGPINPNGNNVTWNGHPYIVQQEWDNAQHGCVLSGP